MVKRRAVQRLAGQEQLILGHVLVAREERLREAYARGRLEQPGIAGVTLRRHVLAEGKRVCHQRANGAL